MTTIEALSKAPAVAELGQFHPIDSEMDYLVDQGIVEDGELFLMSKRNPNNFNSDMISPRDLEAAAFCREDQQDDLVHLKVESYDVQLPPQLYESFVVATVNEVEEDFPVDEKGLELKVDSRMLRPELFANLGFISLEDDGTTSTLLKPSIDDKLIILDKTIVAKELLQATDRTEFAVAA